MALKFNRLLKVVITTCAFGLVSTAPSFATGTTYTNRTCSEFVTPLSFVKGDSQVDLEIDLAEGDVLTLAANAGVGASPGHPIRLLLNGAVTTTLNPPYGTTIITGTSTVNGAQVTITPQWFNLDSALLTISCVPAISESDDIEEITETFTQTQAVADLNSLYNIVSVNARGGLGGTLTNSANGNSFFLSSLGLNQGKDEAGLAMAGSPESTAWVSGRYTKIDGDTIDGASSNLTVGADFKTSTDTLVGVALSYGDTDYDTNLSGTAGNLEATGLTVAAYFASQMPSGLVVDGVLSFGNIDYEIATGATTGSFGATRIGLGVGVYQQFDWNGMVIEPGLNVIFVKETQDAYTDSASTDVAEASFTAGRVSVGPKLYFDGDASFQPWVAVNAEYDFTNSATAAADTPYNDDFFSARVGFGFSSQLGEGTLAASFDVGALGEDSFNSYTAELEFSLPF